MSQSEGTFRESSLAPVRSVVLIHHDQGLLLPQESNSSVRIQSVGLRISQHYLVVIGCTEQYLAPKY